MANQIAQDYIMPMESDGTNSLVLQMLSATFYQKVRSEKEKYTSTKLRSIQSIGILREGKDIFEKGENPRPVPRGCHLKNVDDEVVSLRSLKVKSFQDLRKSETPYIMCCVQRLDDLPIIINQDSMEARMGQYRVTTTESRSTRPNQHATWGPFITNFHRDTMFSQKVHTLSPGSLKLWCFEKTIGQLDLSLKDDAETQMRLVITKPSLYDFFLQEPTQIVRHEGGYAHFVVTFNMHNSQHGQWSALVGWEVNTPKKIHHSMLVDKPLIQSRNGTLSDATEPQFLSGCSKATKLKYSILRGQTAERESFKEKQQANSMQKVYKVMRAKKSKAAKCVGLRRGNTPGMSQSVKVGSPPSIDTLI